MKKNGHRIPVALLKFMRYSMLIGLFLRVFALVGYAENAYTQNNLLNQSLTVEFHDVTLRDALNQIEKKLNCAFICDESLVPMQEKISFKGTDQKLSQVLSKILSAYPVVYQQSDNFILIKEKSTAPQQSQGTVSGIVTDSQTGAPMAGVSVSLKGTTQGTVTDANGAYSLTVVNEDAILVFSFIGYIPQEVKVGTQTKVSIGLIASVESLNQVVVVGYGAQQKKYVTGAISQVKSEELNRYAGSSFAQQLSGKAAGVIINDASAQPGTDPQIVIRGIGTLTAGRAPLIVVDGFPLSEGTSFNSINPADIESVDVLKDPASAAIYGSRAANGVILITTKKGKNEKVTVSFDAYYGFQQHADRVKYADAYQAAEYFTEARDWGYVSKNPANRSIDDDRATRLSKGASLRELRLNYLQPYLDKQPGLTNTNWTDELFRAAPISSYNLAIAGGSAKSNYYVSANYFNQQGIVINNGLQRFSSTIKVDSKLSDRFDFGIIANPSYTVQNYFDNNTDFSNDPIAGMLIMYPFFSPYKPDGTLAISNQIIANTPEDGALGESVVALAKKIKNKRNNFRTFGNTYLSARLPGGLTFKTLLGADYRSGLYDFFNPSDVGQYRGAAPKPAIARETDGSAINYLWENTLTYAKALGNHDINVLAGYTFQKESAATTEITGSGIADNTLDNIAGASAFTATANRYKWVQISYLSRIQYSFLDRYLLSLTMRRDGSSRFGKNTKWGNFPSITAGWILSQEGFYPFSDVLTFAKLRATWGQSGNNQIGSYSSKALVSSSNYVFGSTLGSGFAATTTPNDHLSWETKTSSTVGLDVSLWNKLNLTIDYYSSITKDLLLDVPIPEQSGFSSSIQNIGKVKNSGLELEISAAKITLGPLQWQVSANIATNKNKVLALAPGQKQIIKGSESNFVTKVGGPIAELYGYTITGVYKTQEEINTTPHLSGTLTGDYKIEDRNKDGVINTDDQRGFGTYMPKITYGLSSNLTYKNLELNFSLAGVEGRKTYERSLALQSESGEGFGVPDAYYFAHRYHPTENPDGFLAQPNMGNFSAARKLSRASNLFFQDGDFLRLRNIQLAYTVPKPLASKLRLTNARVYVAANNLFTLTKFRGYNLEATSSDVLTSGLSYTNYPIAKSYILGINLSF
ncbi:SusC/RagA family TonB-linked outer membrane protein [Xanthocytophaga flava]|uniref:SusC/RagA family TonB-linked outer membrane protein n=1 Tax=Xanthocytophaga flava TaxID=3048013 RepID=UPI0028D46EFC|nr:SusC/RagA family TonB-linked outer membrane protein [Xanthocytophaga flavus]